MKPLAAPASVVTAGVSLLADALDQQGVQAVRVDWKPPVEGTAAAVATVMGDRRRKPANALALERMLAAEATLVDVRPASEALGLGPGEFLHAGPPVDWEHASGPMRGALIGAVLLEGLASGPEEAEQKLASGDGLRWEPCHH